MRKYEDLALDLTRIGDNFKPVDASYEDILAPAALALRGTYTVPQDRRALVSYLHLDLMRITAATAAGLYRIVVNVQQRGDIEKVLVHLHALDNNVAASKQVCVHPLMPLFPGDKVLVYTEDLSTGGTVRFELCGSVLEFDAHDYCEG